MGAHDGAAAPLAVTQGRPPPIDRGHPAEPPATMGLGFLFKYAGGAARRNTKSGNPQILSIFGSTG